jgi:hypothetical protein
MTGLAIDQKNNRIFTAEQLLGRVQMFRYFTNAEARGELDQRDAELKKRAEERDAKTKAQAASVSSGATSAPAATQPPAGAPAKSETKSTEPAAVQAVPAPAK